MSDGVKYDCEIMIVMIKDADTYIYIYVSFIYSHVRKYFAFTSVFNDLTFCK